jgi:hypothetical protein
MALLSSGQRVSDRGHDVADIKGNQLNYQAMATYYGQGATYDSIEGQFRKIRKEAEMLREAVASGAQPPAPPRGSGAARHDSGGSGGAPTPKKSRKLANASMNTSPGRVLAGRIAKSISPTKKRAANAIRGVEEEVVSSESSFVGELAMDGGMDSGMGVEWDLEQENLVWGAGELV